MCVATPHVVVADCRENVLIVHCANAALAAMLLRKKTFFCDDVVVVRRLSMLMMMMLKIRVPV